ncbi:hypothetical protein NQZ68_002136 [Dissostichus eleginoides]|nr:hypothetical protein NQZ68_002136 [Dissostichus eleginoides]
MEPKPNPQDRLDVMKSSNMLSEKICRWGLRSKMMSPEVSAYRWRGRVHAVEQYENQSEHLERLVEGFDQIGKSGWRARDIKGGMGGGGMRRAERGRESMTAGGLQSRHGIANEICASTLPAMREQCVLATVLRVDCQRYSLYAGDVFFSTENNYIPQIEQGPCCYVNCPCLSQNFILCHLHVQRTITPALAS